MGHSSSWRRIERQAGMRRQARSLRPYGAETTMRALAPRPSALLPQGAVMLVYASPRHKRKSEILLHNPLSLFRRLLPGEPTLVGNVLRERTAGENESSMVGAPGLRHSGSRAGLCSSLPAAPGSMDGVGSVRHGFRGENGLAVRCASGARCPLATLSAAHCSGRPRWLGQIRKWPPWQSLA